MGSAWRKVPDGLEAGGGRPQGAIGTRKRGRGYADT